ncbi:MAG: hypothetical protein AB7E60_01880 [Sphingobium sp.]
MTIETPSIPDLQAQKAAIDAQIAAASLAGLLAASTVLHRTSTGKVADDLEALQSALPAGEMAAQQIGNVINIIRSVTGLIDGEVARVQAIVDAQPAP